MPTYLNARSAGSAYVDHGGGPNCRQIYEHVQGCPVCQQLFMGGAASPPSKQYPPFIADNGRAFMGATDDAIKISPTVAFLITVFIVILLVYMIRNINH